MAYEVCGKEAKEVKVAKGDRPDLPICPDCMEEARKVAESLTGDVEFAPIPKNAQPIDRFCQVPYARKR